MFGLFKKKGYTLLTSDMLEPVDKDVTTQEAKKAFKQYLVQVGYCDKGEASDLVMDFAEEIKDHLAMLKEDLSFSKSELRAEKTNLKKLKTKLLKLEGKEAEEVSEDIASVKEEIEFFEKEIESHQLDIENFKKSKREFLVESVNNCLRENT